MLNMGEMSARGARDFVGSALRYAQKSAIAMRRNVCVNVAASRVTITHATNAGVGQACAAANTIANPGNNRPYGDGSNDGLRSARSAPRRDLPSPGPPAVGTSVRSLGTPHLVVGPTHSPSKRNRPCSVTHKQRGLSISSW